jgi:serine/threonine protein kinase
MFESEEGLVSKIIFQVIKALEYLHAKGIAHRDIKPENLLYENGVVKLVDFGWAASFVPEKPDTFCGTLDYVSP